MDFRSPTTGGNICWNIYRSDEVMVGLLFSRRTGITRALSYMYLAAWRQINLAAP